MSNLRCLVMICDRMSVWQMQMGVTFRVSEVTWGWLFENKATSRDWIRKLCSVEVWASLSGERSKLRKRGCVLSDCQTQVKTMPRGLAVGAFLYIWRFIKYSDEPVPRFKSLGVSWISWHPLIWILYESPSCVCSCFLAKRYPHRRRVRTVYLALSYPYQKSRSNP